MRMWPLTVWYLQGSPLIETDMCLRGLPAMFVLVPLAKGTDVFTCSCLSTGGATKSIYSVEKATRTAEAYA